MPGLPSAAKQQVSGREPSFGHPHPQVELLERLPLPVADRDEPDEQNQRRPVLPGLWIAHHRVGRAGAAGHHRDARPPPVVTAGEAGRSAPARHGRGTRPGSS